MADSMNSTLRQDAQVIGLVGVAHGVSHFFHLILAPLFPWLKVAFDLSYAELGLLMTVFFIVSGVGQALAGFIVDRVGARTVLFCGIALLCIAALVLASAQHYAMLLAGSMLAGLGNSVFHPADFTLLNKRVSAPRLSHAFSVHGIAGSLGWAAAPLFLAPIAGLAGWRSALLAAACIPFFLLLVLYLNRDCLQTDAGHSAAGKDDATTRSAPPLHFLQLPAVWLCFAFFVLTAIALGGIQSFSVPAVRELYGISLATATAGYTGYMLATAAGMVWGGFLAAKSQRQERIIAVGFAGAALLAWLLATAVVPAWAVVALLSAIGFGAGIAGPSRDLLIRAAAPKNATGRVYGVVYSGLDIGLASAPLLFGALMDAHLPAMLFVAIGTVQALAILTAVRVGFGTSKPAPAAQAT